MNPLSDTLNLQSWYGDLQPARAICELFDFLEGVQFWVKNRNGSYCWVNTACLLNYGLYHRADMMGKTDDQLSPAHIAAQFRADDELVLAGKSVLNRIEMVGRFDHTAQWCVTWKVPLQNARGKIIGTAGMCRALKAGGDDWQGVPLGKVVSFMSDHFHEPLDNVQLAKEAGLSERTFERQFRKEYGLSPQQYVKRLRVRMACHALVYTDHAIGAIAVDHGFADQSHFTREFRELLGETPGDYRKGFRKRSG